jgi:hypothetical protein
MFNDTCIICSSSYAKEMPNPNLLIKCTSYELRCELTIPRVMMRNHFRPRTLKIYPAQRGIGCTLNDRLDIYPLEILSRQSSVSLPSRREIKPPDEPPSQRQTIRAFWADMPSVDSLTSLKLYNSRDLSTDLRWFVSVGLTHELYKIIRHRTPNLGSIPACFVF